MVFLTGCADFPASPTACLTCERGIKNASVDGPNVSVESSELVIHVYRDGDSRWTVRANLSGEGVERLRRNPRLVKRFSRRSVTGSVSDLGPHVAIHHGNVRSPTGKMKDDTLVIAFTVTDAAKRGFGDVLLVDYFNVEGRGPPSYLLGTDRVVIRGPSETVVTKSPPRATVTDGGRSVVWRKPSTIAISGDTYVAFAPDRSRSSRLATWITTTSERIRWAMPWAMRAGIPYAILLVSVAICYSVYVTGKLSVWRVGKGDSFRARLTDKPPVDIPVVVLLCAGLLVGIFSGSGRALITALFVWPPVVPAGMFLLLGLSAKRYPRTNRFATLTLGGTPFVMTAVPTVKVPASYGQVSIPGLTVIPPVVLLLLVSYPVFYLGVGLRRRYLGSETQGDE